MTERKDRYRAALQREEDTADRPSKFTTVLGGYVRVTVEVDPALQHDLTRWAGPAVSAVVLAGTTVLRTLSRAVRP
ncbi:hypothetical protein ACWGI8_22230 [Streptomyces sp. NPDC054841]